MHIPPTIDKCYIAAVNFFYFSDQFDPKGHWLLRRNQAIPAIKEALKDTSRKPLIDFGSHALIRLLLGTSPVPAWSDPHFRNVAVDFLAQWHRQLEFMKVTFTENEIHIHDNRGVDRDFDSEHIQIDDAPTQALRLAFYLSQVSSALHREPYDCYVNANITMALPDRMVGDAIRLMMLHAPRKSQLWFGISDLNQLEMHRPLLELIEEDDESTVGIHRFGRSVREGDKGNTIVTSFVESGARVTEFIKLIA
jgi:hypothetical protein